MSTPVKSAKEMQGYILIIIASILWGTIGIFGKLSFAYEISPETLIALRLIISSATLSVVLTLFDRGSLKILKTDLLIFVVFGFLATAIQRVSYFYAVNLTSATVAAMLCYTYPVFVALSASFILKEKVTVRESLAIVLTFSGAALVVKAYDTSSLNVNLAGILFGLLSSLLFALYVITAKKLRNRYSSWTLTLYGDGIGALALMPIISLSVPQIVGYSPQLWLLIFCIAWVSSLSAYLLYSHALKYVKASKGSVLSVIEPLSATLFSALLIGEKLEGPQMMGVVLALIGVISLFRTSKVAG